MEENTIVKKRIFSLKLVKRIVILLMAAIVFDFFLFPIPAVLAADDNGAQNEANDQGADEPIGKDSPVINGSLPENDTWSVEKTAYYTVTAYNSEEAQCDSTPCITANGFNLCEHGIEDTVAANFLPFGAKIRMPDLFGDRVFVVRDRMNKRYQNRIDIWMLDKQDAKNFGVRAAKIEILEH